MRTTCWCRRWSRRRRAEYAVTRRPRVDAGLARGGLARSRQQAAELIGAGKVSIDGIPAVKPGTAVAATAALSVTGDTARGWVSRGAHKLIGALDTFGVSVVWMPALRRVDSPKFCWIAAHAKWSPLMWATASWPGRCGRILG